MPETNTTVEIPQTLSEYDFWELEAFSQKVEREGFSYAFEEYPPRFESAGYELVERRVARELLRRHLPEIDAAWNANAEAACDRHNAHIDESRRREDHRALWAVRHANGNISPCRTEAQARGLHREPSWNTAALLTRDEPGGQWREVGEES